MLDLIAGYADTWRLLLEYDEDRLLTLPGVQPSTGVLDHGRAVAAIAEFRRDLMVRNEASSLFGNPCGDALAAILGNIEQTMFGEALYRSREEKAAQLLYFVVKDNRFSDGNKRIGSLLFPLYLKEAAVDRRIAGHVRGTAAALRGKSQPSARHRRYESHHKDRRASSIPSFFSLISQRILLDILVVR